MCHYQNAVKKLCHLSDEQAAKLGLSTMSQKDIVEKVILPYAVQVGGQDTRGWRISSDFMKFMAEWGQNCVSHHKGTGELLMELAMQRISKGAIKHEPYDLIESLPKEYQKYSAAWDQPGLMDNACWSFLEKNLQFCLERLENQTWKNHAKLIVFGLLIHFNYDGEKRVPLKEGEEGYEPGKNKTKLIPWGSTLDLLWDDDLVEEVSPRIIALFAEYNAGRFYDPYTISEILMPYWRYKKHYFQKVDGIISWKQVMPYIDFKNVRDENGEPYYGKWKTRFLKLFGLYKMCILGKMVEEIRAYHE